jgi:hypothetical protein
LRRLVRILLEMPSSAEEILKEDHVRPMDLTGRVMKGWATIESEAMAGDSRLERFCQFAIQFVTALPAKPGR